MRLTGVNTFSRPTVINGGTLIVNGSLASGSTVTVASGGTLSGTGTVNGATTVSPGGNLYPGTTAIGTIHFGNTLALSGTTQMRISYNGGVATNDAASAVGALTEGGTLIVTNIGTNALALGNTFKLFTSGGSSGAFTNVILPVLNPGLSWKISTLPSKGTISVVVSTFNLVYMAGTNGALSGAISQTVNYLSSGTAITAVPNPGWRFVNWSDGSTSNPRTDTGVTSNILVTANFAPLVPPSIVGNPGISAGIFSFSFNGTNGQTFKVLGSSNLNIPLNSWSVLTSGVFSGIPLTFTNVVDPGAPLGFYRIMSP